MWGRTFVIFPVRLVEGGLAWFRMVWCREEDRSQPYTPYLRNRIHA